jgi:hypothetical protein
MISLLAAGAAIAAAAKRVVRIAKERMMID